MKNALTSLEFKGLRRNTIGNKPKMEPPTVKAPKISRAAKQRLVPYGNPPQRRANTAYS